MNGININDYKKNLKLGISADEESDNFHKWISKIRDKDTRELLKHMDERAMRITLNNYHLTNYELNLVLDYIYDLQLKLYNTKNELKEIHKLLKKSVLLFARKNGSQNIPDYLQSIIKKEGRLEDAK